MARPPLDQQVVVIRTTITLRSDEDADLIAFFEGISPRKYAMAIKVAMRSGSLLNFGGESGQDDAEMIESLTGFLD